MFIKFCSLLNMHILCPTFGYCMKHEKNLANILCIRCEYYTICFTFNTYLNNLGLYKSQKMPTHKFKC